MRPFLVAPRLDPKPWGGTRLPSHAYSVVGSEPLGELVMTATANRVVGGLDDGRTLAELIAADPIALIGRRGLAATGGRHQFPLLVKLIDAAQPLSIQVHPDDGRAAAAGSLGKTEAWHILAADPGSSFFAGLVGGIGIKELEAAVHAATGEAAGGVAAQIRQLPARVGETVFFPAGTLHALGAGVMLYELQQASEITYRLDDWGRVGADGRPRQTHVAESLEAIDATIRPEIIPPVRLDDAAERVLLVACRYFALDRFRIERGETTTMRAPDSPQTITVVRGAIRLRCEDAREDDVRVAEGQTAIVPAAVAVVEARADEPSEVLRSWVPDLGADIVAPALAGGVTPDALSALSAPLPDMTEAIRRIERAGRLR